MTNLYLRPTGLLTGATAERALRLGRALRLAGSPTAFTKVEIFERSAERRLVEAIDLAAQSRAGVEAAIGRLTAVRGPRGPLVFDRPLIMGILNVTPDSFSDGGRYDDPARAVAHARKLAAEGADIIDVGGESTRPGAALVPESEELARVLPVIERLKADGIGPISIDSRKAAVQRAAVRAGADLINDVSALTFDPAAADVAAETGVPVILMHSQGTPETMQRAPRYEDALLDVHDALAARLEALEARGIPRSRLIVDPGLGFGKAMPHNIALLSGIAMLHCLGVPILVGASRKSFIGKMDGDAPPGERLGGSVATALEAVAQGVQIVRVHDVREIAQALRVQRILAEAAGGAPARA